MMWLIPAAWAISGLIFFVGAFLFMHRTDRRLDKFCRVTPEDERWLATFLANNRTEHP